MRKERFQQRLRKELSTKTERFMKSDPRPLIPRSSQVSLQAQPTKGFLHLRKERSKS